MTSQPPRKELVRRFATNVKKYRIQQGYTQLDIAAKVGLSERFIRYVESGEQVPKVDIAYQLAEALSTTLDELFADSDRQR